MHHWALGQSRAGVPWGEELWSRLASRDLGVAAGYLRESAHHSRRSVGYSAAVLGALMSYSRPFTERADPAANQSPAQRRCFMAFAADLGADLRLHGQLLQMRDEIVALCDLVSVPAAPRNARCFRYPDPRLARITSRLDQPHFSRLVASMRLACGFYRAETMSRNL